MEIIDQTPNKIMRRAFLVLNVVLLAIGACGSPMVMRLYFICDGNRVWLSAWLQTGGWPVIFIPLLMTYLGRRHKEASSTKIFFMREPVFLAAAFIGVLTGLSDYFYAYGVAPPCVHLSFGKCFETVVHRGFRFSSGQAEVHPVFDKRGCIARRRSGSSCSSCEQ